MNHLDYVHEIYSHWIDVTKANREEDTVAAAMLTVATILSEISVAPEEQQPVEVAVKEPNIKVNGEPQKADWLYSWQPQIETTTGKK